MGLPTQVRWRPNQIVHDGGDVAGAVHENAKGPAGGRNDGVRQGQTRSAPRALEAIDIKRGTYDALKIDHALGLSRRVKGRYLNSTLGS